MSIHPMIAALRKHKAGVVLIALQIALTLAIVCNAIFIIGQRIERVNRPTGLAEDNLFLVTQQWVGAPSGDDPDGVEQLDAMQREDLAALSNVPGVESVAPVNSLPLLNSSWNGSVSLQPEQDLRGTLRTTYYFSDAQFLPTLGLQLVAGRNFTEAEVEHMGFRDQRDRPIAIISQALSEALFPQGGAVGKSIYLNGSSAPTTVVGVVARLQVPSTGGWASTFAWHSTIVPVRLDAFFTRYAVRTRPGQLATVMAAAAPTLRKVNPLRVLDEDAVQSFAEIRARAYRADVGMAALMGVICLILLAVTAAGIVGLTSFWVGQRHRQIGIRRALGATRGQILRYFQLENLFLVSLGIGLGLVLAYGLNQVLMAHYELPRLPLYYPPLGAMLLWVLGQAAVFGPAHRAAAVPPAVATRGA